MATSVKVEMWKASDDTLHETKAKAEIHDANKALEMVYNDCGYGHDNIVDFKEFIKVLRNNEKLIGIALATFKEHGVK